MSKRTSAALRRTVALGATLGAGLLFAGGAQSQAVIADMIESGESVYFAPVLTPDQLNIEYVGALLSDFMQTEGAVVDAPYLVEAHCYVRSPQSTFGLSGDCSDFTGIVINAARQFVRPVDVARGFLSNFDRIDAPEGLPTPGGAVATDRDGVQLIFRLANVGSDAPASKPPVAAAPNPLIWTETNAAPLTPVERTLLSPDLAPPQITLRDEVRPIPRGIALDLWFSTNWPEDDEPDAPPTILAIDGEDGGLFSLHVLSDHSGFAIAGGAETIYKLDAPLAPGRRHRVSLRSKPGETELYVDGEKVDAIKVGFRPASRLRRVTIGALGEGGWPFDGYVGGVRLWGSSLDHVFDRTVAALSNPEARTPHKQRLVLSSDAHESRFAMTEAPGWWAPIPGWYRQSGQNETRIHNYHDFVDGHAPNLSPLHEAADARLENSAVYGPSAKDALSRLTDAVVAPEEQGGGHTQFSVHPLYRVEVDDGLDPDKYTLRDKRGRFVRPDSRPFPTGEVTAFWIDESEDALTGVSFLSCERPEGVAREDWRPHRPLVAKSAPRRDADLEEAARVVCESGQENASSAIVWLDSHEDIRGLSWRILQTGEIGAVEVHTNRRTYGPYANGAWNRGEITALTPKKSIWMDAGVGFYGLQGVSEDAFTDLAFVAPPFIDQPGVTIIAENGDALRYRQTTQALYRGWPVDLPAPQTVALFENPTLRPQAPGVMLATGMDAREDRVFGTRAVALELAVDRAPSRPSDTYNNTFVALSKAVNLQANYVGYDLVQMDPIHLTRSGATGRIFREPDGDSKDYYDFNRIFVPRGLTFVPEFTGDIHKESHETSSYQEFKQAVSNSVSFGVSSKALPSFSMSSTMREAAETIAERRMSRSIGFSRAYFYDLVLRKDEIRLHPDFVSRVFRLAERGDFAAFIETFGTHYPVAVVYGGAAVLTIDTSETTRGALLQNGVDTKTQVGLLLGAKTGTSLDLGSEKSRETTQQFRSTVGSSNENFYWVGGAHVGLSAESWSVGAEGVVPVHVSLRPIDELLSGVYFTDPDVNTRLRHALKAAVDDYIADHADAEPDESPNTRRGFLEVRMDHLYCGTPPDDRAFASWGRLEVGEDEFRMVYPEPKKPAPPNDGMPALLNGLDFFNRVRNTREPVSMFVYPYISFSAYDRLHNHLADFSAPPQAMKDETGELIKAKPIKAICNTYDDILPKSPYLQNHATIRVPMSRLDLTEGAKIEILDRRAREYGILHHHASDDASRSELVNDALAAGFTLGTKLLWEEYVTGEGSLMIDYLKKNGEPEQFPDSLARLVVPQAVMCDPEDLSLCPPRTPEDFTAISGKWFKAIAVMRPPKENCLLCMPYELHYSLRYIE